MIDGGFIDGVRYAGLEIRSPGRPSLFGAIPATPAPRRSPICAQSENVATGRDALSATERIDEEGVQAFGYRHTYMFPIRVTPREKDKPAILALSLDYAACEKLCLPVHADTGWSCGAGRAPDRKSTAASTKIPRHLGKAQVPNSPKFVRGGAGGEKASMAVTLRAGQGARYFHRGAPGYYVDAAPAGESGAFLLTLAEHPAEQTHA